MDPKGKGKGKDIQPTPPIPPSFGGVYRPQQQHHQPPEVPVTNATDIVGPISTSQSKRSPFGAFLPRRKYLQKQQPPQPQPPQQQPEEVKKKRGRPRKYVRYGDGNVIDTILPPAKPPAKRSEEPEPVLIPHIIEVNIGEVLEFTGQEEPRTVCIISGTGAVSSATLSSPPNHSLGLKGLYDINNLRGSFTNNGSTQISGQLSVTLDGPDGKLVGGNVVGPLIAATQVQVVVGSFVTAANSGDNDEGVNPEAASAPSEFTDDDIFLLMKELTDDIETQKGKQQM